MKKGLIINVDQTQRVVEQEDFDLEFLQKIVGGNIQLVKTIEDQDMVVNEEGIMLKLPPNPRATELLHPHFKEGFEPATQVYGNVFIFIKGNLS